MDSDIKNDHADQAATAKLEGAEKVQLTSSPIDIYPPCHAEHNPSSSAIDRGTTLGSCDSIELLSLGNTLENQGSTGDCAAVHPGLGNTTTKKKRSPKLPRRQTVVEICTAAALVLATIALALSASAHSTEHKENERLQATTNIEDADRRLLQILKHINQTSLIAMLKLEQNISSDISKFEALPVLIRSLNQTIIDVKQILDGLVGNMSSMSTVLAATNRDLGNLEQLTRTRNQNTNDRLSSVNSSLIQANNSLQTTVYSLVHANNSIQASVSSLSSSLLSTNSSVQILRSNVSTLNLFLSGANLESSVSKDNFTSLLGNYLQLLFNNGPVYTVWGKESCPSGSEQLYYGFAAGPYTSDGGGSDVQCLPRTAKYGRYANHEWGSILSKAKYQMQFEDQPFSSNLTGKSIPCAVCEAKGKKAVFMQPATPDCPSGWNREYHGYLMSEYYESPYRPRTSYLCVIDYPSTESGNPVAIGIVENGPQFYTAAVRCEHADGQCVNENNSASSSGYFSARELTCSVCSK